MWIGSVEFILDVCMKNLLTISLLYRYVMTFNLPLLCLKHLIIFGDSYFSVCNE